MPKKPSYDKEAYEVFRQSLPVDCQNEEYIHLQYAFNVPLALFLSKELPLQSVHVESWAKARGLNGPEQIGDNRKWPLSILCGVSDDEAADSKINTKIPILFVMHSYRDRATRKNVEYALLIDGNKRLRKAFLQKQLELKARLLPAKLAKLVVR